MSPPTEENNNTTAAAATTAAASSSTQATGLRLPFWIQGRLTQYFGKWEAFSLAGKFYLHRLWLSLRQGHVGALVGRANQEVHEQAFAEFYQSVEHHFAAYESTQAVPRLVAAAHGVVLDLGPGTGLQLRRFDPARIEHIYGVEPNGAFREGFLAKLRADRLGVDGKYTLIHCGLEDGDVLARFGVREGSLDCVVSMQVMCSMPDFEAQIRNMHRLLKPGGELIFWEHCCNTRVETRVVQWLWSLVWPRVFGGCSFHRVTRDKVVGAAEWEVVDVEYDELVPYCIMPRLYGRLVKPKGNA